MAAFELKELETLRLIQSCPTRWNSVYFLLKRYFELFATVNDILEQHDDSPDSVTTSEKAILKDVLAILHFFEEATRDMSGEKYVTSSKMIPYADYLRVEIGKLEIKTLVGRKVKESLVRELNERFRPLEHNQVLAVSTFLDPEYKLMYFKTPQARENGKSFCCNSNSIFNAFRVFIKIEYFIYLFPTFYTF